MQAIAYLASNENPLFLGYSAFPEMANQIVVAKGIFLELLLFLLEGMSGRNIEYVYELAEFLRKHDVQDDHVFQLEKAIQAILYGLET